MYLVIKSIFLRETYNKLTSDKSTQDNSPSRPLVPAKLFQRRQDVTQK